uniref:Clc-like protein n=1 Tax=Globodera rostochiensis TaxID=31243 RepID=A0A914HNT9_GLORO
MAEPVRKAVIFCACVFTMIGMGLSLAAILTPSWQVVNLQEYNSVHEHGLWLDCIRHSRDGGGVLLRRYATLSEPLHCVYKFDYDKYSGTFDLEDDNSPVGEVNRHRFYGWHTATLIMLALALLTGFCSVCLGACGCCYASLSLVFTATALLTTFLSSVAEGVFFFFSHRADNRFIKGIVGTYEQRVGLAFFLQMGACFFHFVAFLIAMVATYFAFTRKGVALDRERYSLQTSSKTNMTNVGRSMDFEHPVFVHNQMPAPSAKPRMPPYMKQQQNVQQQNSSDDFDRAVADSMPELHNRSFQSDFSGRIRRKSETCV